MRRLGVGSWWASPQALPDERPGGPGEEWDVEKAMAVPARDGYVLISVPDPIGTAIAKLAEWEIVSQPVPTQRRRHVRHNQP